MPNPDLMKGDITSLKNKLTAEQDTYYFNSSTAEFWKSQNSKKIHTRDKWLKLKVKGNVFTNCIKAGKEIPETLRHLNPIFCGNNETPTQHEAY